MKDESKIEPKADKETKNMYLEVVLSKYDLLILEDSDRTFCSGTSAYLIASQLNLLTNVHS